MAPTVKNPFDNGFLARLSQVGTVSNAMKQSQGAVSASRSRQKALGSSIMGLLATPDVQPTKSVAGGNGSASVGAMARRVAPVPGGTGKSNAIISEAEKYLGRWYKWGGSNPSTSFDCSGLVQWAYKKVGINLPRVSADQARYGRRVALNQLRPGDLVAWDNSSRNSGADHIAIYIGGGKIIEAARTGTQIRTRPLGKNEGAWGVQVMK